MSTVPLLPMATRAKVRLRAAALAITALGATTALSGVAAAQSGGAASAATTVTASYPGFAFGSETGEVLLSMGALLSNATSFIPQSWAQDGPAWAPDAPHPFDRTADRWSDVTGAYGGVALGMGSGYLLESAYFVEAGARSGAGVHALRQALVEAQATLYTRSVVFALKRLTGRCRPKHFVAAGCVAEVRDSFPSGHTAPMGALAGTRLVLSSLSTGPSGIRWASFGLAEAMAITTAVLRVEAGAHSWSDVVAGFLIGHAIGVLVAFAHPFRAGDPSGPPGSAATPAEGGLALRYARDF